MPILPATSFAFFTSHFALRNDSLAPARLPTTYPHGHLLGTASRAAQWVPARAVLKFASRLLVGHHAAGSSVRLRSAVRRGCSRGPGWLRRSRPRVPRCP